MFLACGVSPRVCQAREYCSPRRGRQILGAVWAAAFSAIFLSPLRGLFLFFLPHSWGSRPRLCMCRRFSAPLATAKRDELYMALIGNGHGDETPTRAGGGHS